MRKPILILALVIVAVPAMVVLASLVAVLIWFYFPPDPVISLHREEKINLSISSKGVDDTPRILCHNGPELAFIDAVLKKKQGQWTRTFHTYAPAILVRSKSFMIDFRPRAGAIVVNYAKADGSWAQLICPLTANESRVMEEMLIIGWTRDWSDQHQANQLRGCTVAHQQITVSSPLLSAIFAHGVPNASSVVAVLAA